MGGGLGATSLYGYKMKIIFFLLLFTGLNFSQNKIYHNPELGINFDYSETEYNPFGLVYDSARTKSLNDWNNFISNTVGISFKYPKGLFAKDSLLDSFYGESKNDSSVYIGYNNILNDSIFYAVVVIYRSNRNFEQIAEDLFFEKDTTESDSSWIILGRQGLPSEATYFEGKNCQGLRGQTFVGFYHCEGGYAGLGDVYRTLLVFDCVDKSRLVLFLDSAGMWDCLETEGVPEDDLWEDEFFKIASTIRIAK